MKIIILEDEAIIARGLREILMDGLASPSIMVVLNLQDFESELQKNEYDLAFLDINLGGRPDGIAAGRLIRSKFSMRIVFLTAYSSDDVIDSLALIEPDGYLLKPFNEAEVLAVAKQLLKQKKAKPTLGNISIQAAGNGLKPKVEFFQDALDKIFIVSIFSENGSYIYFNDALSSHTGFSRDELSARESIFEQSFFGNAQKVEEIFDCIEKEGLWEGEISQKNKAGKTIWSYSYVFELASIEESLDRYFICIGSDITAQKESEKELRQILNVKLHELTETHRQLASVWKDSTMVGFNSILIHEIKRPLSSVALQVGLIIRDFAEFLPAKLRDNLGKVKVSLDGTSALMNYMGSLFRRNGTEQFERIDLKNMLETVANFTRVLFPYDGIKIEVETPRESTIIYGYPDVLFVVIFNLLKNACEAFEPSQNIKEIKASINDENQQTIILVTDNKEGGIPEEIVSHLFKDTLISNKRSGSGMGLKICRNVLHSINAQLELVTTSSLGSTFQITLDKKLSELPPFEKPNP